MKKIIMLLICGILFTCGVPDNKDVRREFLATHPEASIEFIGIGEGDFENVYFHIQYRIPTDPRMLEEIWLYQKQADGTWVCTNKNGPKEFKKYNK